MPNELKTYPKQKNILPKVLIILAPVLIYGAYLLPNNTKPPTFNQKEIDKTELRAKGITAHQRSGYRIVFI